MAKVPGTGLTEAVGNAFNEAVDALKAERAQNFVQSNEFAQSMAKHGLDLSSLNLGSITGNQQVAALTNDDMQRSNGLSEGRS